jgi:ComF family protein
MFAWDAVARNATSKQGALRGIRVRWFARLSFCNLPSWSRWRTGLRSGCSELVRENATAPKADLIVPVPLHKIRRRERGFNKAEMLSKRLAKRLGLPHQGILLLRKRPRPDKHLLTCNERWQAVRGAFATRPGSQVDKQRVLLVDDVMTTGATLAACAKALREAGASSVLGLTVARAILNPQKVSR